MNKKERILESGLSLFAEHGFDAVSTYKIAKRAEVSEGLVFKHFKSKKGLLKAILDIVEQKVSEIFAHVISKDDPEEVIKTFINTIYEIDEAEHDYWRLSFKLKWDQEFYKPEEMKPVLEKLEWAFGKLGRKYPEVEAEMLFQNIESISIAILRMGKDSQLKFREHLIRKYLNE